MVFGLDPSSEPVEGMCIAKERAITIDPLTEKDDLAELGNVECNSVPVAKTELPRAETCVGDTEFAQQIPSIPAGLIELMAKNLFYNCYFCL